MLKQTKRPLQNTRLSFDDIPEVFCNISLLEAHKELTACFFLQCQLSTTTCVIRLFEKCFVWWRIFRPLDEFGATHSLIHLQATLNSRRSGVTVYDCSVFCCTTTKHCGCAIILYLLGVLSLYIFQSWCQCEFSERDVSVRVVLCRSLRACGYRVKRLTILTHNGQNGVDKRQ